MAEPDRAPKYEEPGGVTERHILLTEADAQVAAAFGVTEAEYLARYPGGRKGYVRDTLEKLAAREEEGGIVT